MNSYAWKAKWYHMYQHLKLDKNTMKLIETFNEAKEKSLQGDIVYFVKKDKQDD